MNLQESMSEGARDLLKKLLKRDPGKRITAVQALEHPWVKEGGSASDASLAGSVVIPIHPPHPPPAVRICLCVCSVPKNGNGESSAGYLTVYGQHSIDQMKSRFPIPKFPPHIWVIPSYLPHSAFLRSRVLGSTKADKKTMVEVLGVAQGR